MNTEKEKNMTIDEEKIREAAEGEADERLKEDPVWKLLDAVEGKRLN